jgi:vacuolar-type H+-ATPase catalytic subunit A/Vma1
MQQHEIRLHGKILEIMAEKGFPTHLIKTIQSMYQNANLIIRKNRVNINTSIEIITGTV